RYLDRNLKIGDPAFDAFEREQYGIGYSFEHRFNDIVSFNSKLRYSDVAIDFQSLQMSGPISEQGVIPRHALRSIEDVAGVSLDNHAQFDFDTGAIGHIVLAGLDYQNSTSNWRYRFGAASPLDVANPEYGRPIGPLAPIIDSGQ
ncbi:TonB-dependent siderophore receptor, partial [Rhizobiaceae sp. 2RAB30]